jgi:hypothetical protein
MFAADLRGGQPAHGTRSPWVRCHDGFFYIVADRAAKCAMFEADGPAKICVSVMRALHLVQRRRVGLPALSRDSIRESHIIPGIGQLVRNQAIAKL